MDKRLSTHLSYQSLSAAKKLDSPSVCDENKSLRLSALQTKTSVDIPQENSLPPCEWERQIASSLLMPIM